MNGNGRVGTALRLFEEGRSRAEVAEALGIQPASVSQLLSRAGYRWDRERRAYVPKTEAEPAAPRRPAEGTFELTPEARELLRRAGEVLQLLDGGPAGGLAETFASPLVRGRLVVKSLRLPLPLVQAVERFAQQRQLTQKQLFTAALIEFLQRRGADDHDAF